jgi:hypothetical protein
MDDFAMQLKPLLDLERYKTVWTIPLSFGATECAVSVPRFKQTGCADCDCQGSAFPRTLFGHIDVPVRRFPDIGLSSLSTRVPVAPCLGITKPNRLSRPPYLHLPARCPVHAVRSVLPGDSATRQLCAHNRAWSAGHWRV